MTKILIAIALIASPAAQAASVSSSKKSIEEALKRFPEWDVDWDNTEMVHTGSSVRGYSKLPITF